MMNLIVGSVNFSAIPLVIDQPMFVAGNVFFGLLNFGYFIKGLKND